MNRDTKLSSIFFGLKSKLGVLVLIGVFLVLIAYSVLFAYSVFFGSLSFAALSSTFPVMFGLMLTAFFAIALFQLSTTTDLTAAFPELKKTTYGGWLYNCLQYKNVVFRFCTDSEKKEHVYAEFLGLERIGEITASKIKTVNGVKDVSRFYRTNTNPSGNMILLPSTDFINILFGPEATGGDLMNVLQLISAEKETR